MKTKQDKRSTKGNKKKTKQTEKTATLCKLIFISLTNFFPAGALVSERNMNDEVLGRLKQLASSVQKKSNTPRKSGCGKDGEAKKEEGLEKNPKQNKGEAANTDTGSLTGEL